MKKIIISLMLWSLIAPMVSAQQDDGEQNKYYSPEYFTIDNVKYHWEGVYGKVNVAGIGPHKGGISIRIPETITQDINIAGIGLRTMTFTVTGIDENAFTTARLDTLALPGTIRELPSLSLSRLTLIRHLELPKGLKVIDSDAISIILLDSLIIPEGVRLMKHKAIKGCSSTGWPDQLEYIELPSTLEYMDYQAIHNCQALKKIRIKATVPPEATVQSFGHECHFAWNHDVTGGIEGCVLEVPQGCADTYRTNPAWGTVFNDIVEFSTASLPEPAAGAGAKRFEARAEDGRIVVTAAKPVEISVTQPDGRVLFTGTVSGSRTLRVPRGVCVVSAQGQSTKVLVK